MWAERSGVIKVAGAPVPSINLSDPTIQFMSEPQEGTGGRTGAFRTNRGPVAEQLQSQSQFCIHICLTFGKEGCRGSKRILKSFFLLNENEYALIIK